MSDIRGERRRPGPFSRFLERALRGQGLSRSEARAFIADHHASRAALEAKLDSLEDRPADDGAD